MTRLQLCLHTRHVGCGGRLAAASASSLAQRYFCALCATSCPQHRHLTPHLARCTRPLLASTALLLLSSPFSSHEPGLGAGADSAEDRLEEGGCLCRCALGRHCCRREEAYVFACVLTRAFRGWPCCLPCRCLSYDSRLFAARSGCSCLLARWRAVWNLLSGLLKSTCIF